MSSNAPENVETDERFNSLDQKFLNRAVRLNFTAAIRQTAQKSANNTMPIMLMQVMGREASREELMDALLDAYTALAVVLEMSKLVDKVEPFAEVDDIPKERRLEVKALISQHPLILEGIETINNLVKELRPNI